VRTGWTVRNIYLYLVAFATLMMVLGGTVGLARTLVALALPLPQYVPGPLELHERAAAEGVTVAELEARLAEEREQTRRQERAGTARRIVDAAALVLVALPVYLYHWRQILIAGPTPERAGSDA